LFNLGQPGTCFWAGHLTLIEKLAGRFYQLELGLELFDAPAGGLERVGLVALGPGALPGVDKGLVAPPVQGVLRDAELGHEVLDRLTGEHPLTGAAPKFGGVVPWHIWLLVNRAKLS
jgi:hypothetical protein